MSGGPSPRRLSAPRCGAISAYDGQGAATPPGTDHNSTASSRGWRVQPPGSERAQRRLLVKSRYRTRTGIAPVLAWYLERRDPLHLPAAEESRFRAPGHRASALRPRCCAPAAALPPGDAAGLRGLAGVNRPPRWRAATGSGACCRRRCSKVCPTTRRQLARSAAVVDKLPPARCGRRWPMACLRAPPRPRDAGRLGGRAGLESARLSRRPTPSSCAGGSGAIAWNHRAGVAPGARQALAWKEIEFADAANATRPRAALRPAEGAATPSVDAVKTERQLSRRCSDFIAMVPLGKTLSRRS